MNLVQGFLKEILSFSSDIVVIVALTAIFASVGLFLGKGRLVSLILAFYPTGLLFGYLPFNIQGNTFYNLAIFLALFLLMSHVIHDFISTEFSYSRIKKTMEVVALGLVASSLVILSSYHIVSLSSLYNFGSSIDVIFATKYIFWWLLAPFVILFIFRR